MDKPFSSLLQTYKISPATADILKDEQILTLETFLSLEEEHFTILAKKLKVGQHALLQRLWHHQKKNNVRVILYTWSRRGYYETLSFISL